MKEKIKLEKIKIRKILKSDLKRAKEFQNYINSLIEEEAMILLNKKKSLSEEKEWLKTKLKNKTQNKEVSLLAEYDSKIAGSAHIKLKTGRESHVGEFGISIRKEYRGIGLGEKIMSEVLNLAKKELKSKPKVFRLSVFPNNKPAMNLYKKIGFKIVARIPKQLQFKNKLLEEVIMIKINK